MRNRLKNRTTLFFLLFFAVSVLVRVFLTLFPKNAAIYTDELFYLELAQNIWTRGVTVYELPLRFTKLLYPLLLSPFYLITDGIQRTGVISVFNALLLSSALIPGYLLARRLLKKDSRIVLSLLFLAFSPNLLFSVTFMAENLYYPLLLWGFYFAYRFFTSESRTPLQAASLGFFAFLLYLTKETGAAYAAALVFLLLRELSCSQARRSSALCLGAFLCGFLLPFVLVRFILFGNLGYSYAPQAGFSNLSDTSHLMFFLWAAFIHLLYFLASVFFVPVALPLSRFRRFSTGKQSLLLLSVIYVLCTAFGIAFGVSVSEDYPLADVRVHLRYLLGAGFPFLLLALAEPEEAPELRDGENSTKNRTGVLFLSAGIFSALLLLLTRLPRFASPVDSPMAQVALWLGGQQDLWVWMARALLICLIFLVMCAFLLRRSRRVLLPLALVLVLALETTNGVLFFHETHAAEKLPRNLSAQAAILAETVRDPGERLLVVADDDQSPLLKALNTFSGRDYALVTEEDLEAMSGSDILSADGSVPVSEAGLPAHVNGFSAQETYSFSGIDTVLVLSGSTVLEPGAYADITPAGIYPSRLYRAKDPARLTPLDRRSCYMGEYILFRGEDPNCVRYDLTGFSSPESVLTWTDGSEASLTVRPRVAKPADLLVSLECVTTNGLQFCSVLANSTPVADFELLGANDALTFVVPAEAYADTGLLTLSFLFPNACEPGNGDPRLLAVAFGSLMFDVE